MKRLSLSLLLTAFTAILFSSCQKEIDGSVEQESLVTGDFRAKVDGVQWVADRVALADRSGGQITIVGMGTGKKMIGIIVEDLGVGTYTLDENSLFDVGTLVDSTEANPFAYATNQGPNPGDAGGTLTITSIDVTKKRISGTFSFKVYRQFDDAKKNITEGSFTDLSYAPRSTSTSSSDTMRVKINGTSWTPPQVVGIKTSFPPPLSSIIAVTGTDMATMKSVSLQMPGDITPGTYTFDLLGGTYLGLYNPSSSGESQGSVSGTLTILEHNTTSKRIRGNFNFVGETILPPVISSNLTEGYFSVKYP